MPDIFLSYNRDDQARAKLFADAFQREGLSVWWDVGLRSGEAYDEVTESALRGAKAVVVLWSKKSVQSRWVRSEATLADRNKTLVPAMIEACERPVMFELTQTAELSHWRGDAGDKAWLAFLADVRRFVGEEATAKDFPPVAPAAEPILAVLPFDNLSADEEMTFFSDGVSEEIIQRLSRGAQMKVIGRTSSFQFRGERKGEAAATLRCTHILDGSIRRAAGRVRIAAHLAEAAGHTTLWSERYDATLDDIFAVQDEISEQIATALHRTFESFSTPGVDPSDYDLYLRATLFSFAPEEMRRSIALLESVTSRAKDFTEAWSRLAWARAFQHMYSPFRERPAEAARAKQAADRALALDPENAEAWLAQLLIQPNYGAFLQAEEIAARLRSAPSGDGTGMFVGRFLRSVGRARKAAELSESAYRLNSLDPSYVNLYALAIMAVGRVAESALILEDVVSRAPDMSFGVANLMRAYAFAGDWAGVDRLLDPNANRPFREFEAGVPFIRAKQTGSAESVGVLRTDMEDRVAKIGCLDVARMVYAAHLGMTDRAYELAEHAHLGPRGDETDIMGPDAYGTGMLFWEIMPEIRVDPRFVKLCARLGLVEYWLTTQKWPDCADAVPYDFRAACEAHRDYPRDKFFG
ncbi:MAG: TIR domain-containing protein [Hyphomonadaceae bacterium]